jgi:4-carboxymuconolactone decarboxylase
VARDEGAGHPRVPPAPRLATIGPDDLDERQREMWDSVLSGPRGARLTGPARFLDGPFNAWLRAPVAGKHAGALGEELRFRSSLSDALVELAIVVAGARWRSELEFWSHARQAARKGIPDAVLDAVRDGRRPPFDDVEQALVYDLVHPLVEDGFIGDDAYARAQARFGDSGVVELVMLTGYYTMVSLTNNAFAVPLRPGVGPVWPAPSG